MPCAGSSRFVVLRPSLLAGACGAAQVRPSASITLQGQVLAVTPDHQEATIKHEEIKGFMPAMTMPYKVKDRSEFEALAPGDLINATLVVVTNDAYLTDVKKVGEAPLEQPPAETPAPSASSGFELLKPGEPCPTRRSSIRTARRRTFSGVQGHRRSCVTFIYTKCPMPTFCPLMDRHFAAIQEKLKDDPALKAACIWSASASIRSPTRRVLKKHARELSADPKTWTFLTGDRDDIDKFARAVRRVGRAGAERPARHHAQPADRDRRRRRQAGQDLHRQRVDARAGARGPEARGECATERCVIRSRRLAFIARAAASGG